MPDKLDPRRLEDFLIFVSECSRVRNYESFFHVLAERAGLLFDFERLTILLCDDNRQIQRSVAIGNQAMVEMTADEIQLTEMDLILQSLITGSASSGSAGICTPMMSSGRMVGALCLSTQLEQLTNEESRLLSFLVDSLAGTLDRLAQGSTIIRPIGAAPRVDSTRGDSVAATHALSLRMSYLAQHDMLTGLPNRWLLNERLARALALASRHERRLAVLFLDLDRFKEINDSLGHAIGDQVLRQVSERLVKCIRISDTVSRIGGDEFVILLPEIDNEKDASTCAEKIIRAILEPLNTSRGELHITLSVGIGVYPGNGEDAETLIQSADAAMYHAKSLGRGKYHFFRRDMTDGTGKIPVIADGMGQSMHR